MDSVCFPEDVSERKVSVVGSELVENYTVYIMEVTDGDHRWTVKHRYSDFHDLHEKLTAEQNVDKQLLPPKKMLGKNSRSLVERRQKELEVYLQTLLLQFPSATPTPLACFLHFHLYEINGITAALAEELFHKGEQLLLAGEVFSLRPLQLYSVTQQLRLAKPTCCSGDAKTDLGHILDFTCRLRYLKVPGTSGPVGTSNIQEASLPFDLSVFKSLLQIEISECSSQQIRGLPSLRSSLATLSIHYSTDTMMSILVPEASEFSQWEAEGAEPDCPVTAVIPVWKNLTTLDMSHNHISTIDSSVKLIPQVEFLDLSYNQLSSVENLQYLYNLVHVDLSFNGLRDLEAAHTRLGNIKTLSLAGNQLDRLTGLTKLYSLVNLDLSHNQLAQLEEIRNIGSLPCLEKLSLSGNPMCIIPDYRTKVLAQFWDRAAEVCLDGQVTTEKELDTVEVLKAIQKAKEVKDRMSSSEKKISEETRLSAAVPPHSSSSSCCSSSAVAPPAVSSSPSSSSSSCPAQQAVCPSQEVKSREEAVDSPNILPPVDAELPPTTFNTQNNNLPADQNQVRTKPHDCSRLICMSPSSRPVEIRCSSCSASCCPLLPSHLLSLSSSNKDFITQLSQRLGSALKEEEEEEEERSSDSREVQSHVESTEVGSPSLGSRDGYFEMGLSDSMEEVLVSSSTSLLPAALLEEPGHRVEPCEEKEEEEEEEEEVVEEVQVSRVLWCYCLRVEEIVEQKEACLVLTDRLLGLLYISDDLRWTNQDTAQEQSPAVEEVLSSLQTDVLLPYSQLLLSSQLPDSCLGLGLRDGPTRWYLFSDPPGLRQARTELTALLQLQPAEPQLLRSLLNSWELEESQGARGGYPAHLLLTASSSTHLSSPASRSHPLLADVLSQAEEVSLPSLLFLTHRHLWVLKVDFAALADRERSNTDLHCSSSSSWSRLVRVPLGWVALHPRLRAPQLGDGAATGPCPAPGHHHRMAGVRNAQTADAGSWASCRARAVGPRGPDGWLLPGGSLLVPGSRDHLVLPSLDGRSVSSSSSSSSRPSASSSASRGRARARCGAPLCLGLSSEARRDAGLFDPAGGPRGFSHAVDLLLDGWRLLLVFPLSQDRHSFLVELSQRRASLEGLKTLALPRTSRPCLHQGQHREGQYRSGDQCCCTSTRTSTAHRKPQSCSGCDSSLLQAEENQPPPHLSPGLSPGLKLLAGLGGQQLLAYIHSYITLSEVEEVRQVLWLSVVLYKSPEAELTSCLLLTTNAIYFLLEDAASHSHHSLCGISDSRDPDVCLCCCLTIRLSELLSVNVGLFDQYFRIVGRSADQIVCCLSRDTYGTGVFLQELMAALSLQQQVPPPEPSEQDFYSQFTNTTTGKMQNYELVHSSRVKFIYPSEEEMGDLTFIVAERKTLASVASSSSRSFNILLYLLVFQVQIPSCPSSSGSAPSQSDPAPYRVLQPRTLILTSTDVFLLDEDYVSYPLPDFAKEPPSRERYQLREARRIRDLDRVLLGYQTYPQALTLVFDDLPGPDLLCHLTMDHFTAREDVPPRGGGGGGGAEGEVQWCIFVPGADSRERLISLLARQWEALCSRELPVELTG
ncbi:nischarin [Diretmus argenteus]